MTYRTSISILIGLFILIWGGCAVDEIVPTGSIIPSVTGRLLDSTGNRFDAEKLEKIDYTLIYFSAHWCPPCRKFTPQLVQFYTNQKEDTNFEIIFVSADRDENAMRQYFAQMPWLAVEYDQIEETLLGPRYAGPGGIPCLVMIDGDGNVLSHSYEGREYVGPHKVLQDLADKLNEKKEL